MGSVGDPHTMQVDGWMTQVARMASLSMLRLDHKLAPFGLLLQAYRDISRFRQQLKNDRFILI